VESSSRAFGGGSQLVRGKELGSGSFGKVYSAERLGEPDDQTSAAQQNAGVSIQG